MHWHASMRHIAQLLWTLFLLHPSFAFLQLHSRSQERFLSRWPSLLWHDTSDEEQFVTGMRPYAANNREALRWVVQSIEKNGILTDHPPSNELLRALKDLEGARTQKRVAEVGLKLQGLPIQNTESVFCQERVIKATAISGLLTVSLDLFNSLLDKGHIPSDIAYTALCKSLRQARRVGQLEQVLIRLRKASKTNINPVAYNSYIAALCDSVTKQDAASRRNLKIEDVGHLEKARALLDPVKAYKTFRVKPDESSYATVLHAAATVGNRAMVNELWTEMKQQSIAANRYAYNALMKAICNEGPDFDTEAINLFHEMAQDPFLQPDRFTIDLVLLPLLRTEGLDRVCALLRDFIQDQRSQPKILDQAFSSFLNTLVRADEVQVAQLIFDTFLLAQPQLDAKVASASVRHYNILLNGLRGSISRTKSTVDREEIRKEFERLYTSMIVARIRPDEYTLTILMGVVKTSFEIMTKIRSVVVEMGVEITPPVLRSILIACGEVNDPSSACWFFDTFQREINDSKTWNALIDALSKGAELDSYSQLDIMSSKAARLLNQVFDVAGHEAQPGIASVLNGKTCSESALLMLEIMNGYLDVPFPAPRPNAQSYCLVASTLQHDNLDSATALALFQNATNTNIQADGRFVNAVFRCCGSDIDGALKAWKGYIRQACLAAERAVASKTQRSTSKNLLAAYQGLLYVSGRALRPDIALRIVYAMNKEGVEVNEMALQCYQGGKRKATASGNDSALKSNAISFGEQFESLLVVECTKYDARDSRREGDKRVRIIL